ncbi:hypothetical protein D917_06814 [Trichinella nativa]|uniref:Uncharacterized protein n=1 Tax=Trichinella nativa TaxID=6335 RepID=A0A1Y3ER42_9BILA|nr:hypothetical protein D917_06814 [Trichinella nativa]
MVQKEKVKVSKEESLQRFRMFQQNELTASQLGMLLEKWKQLQLS